MKRLFWIALGAGAGVMAVKQVSKLAESLAPTSLVGNLARSVDGFFDEVRVGMRERETQLRGDLGLDGTDG